MTLMPPRGFNPKSADPRWRQVLGIPARPRKATEATEWDRKWDRTWSFTEPRTMCPTTEIAGFAGFGTLKNWTGVVDRYYKNYYVAQAQLGIPRMDASCGKTRTSLALWTGLGGYAFPHRPDTDLIQNGLAIQGPPPGLPPNYGEMFAWWEVIDNQAAGRYVHVVPVSGYSWPMGHDVQLTTQYQAGRVTFSWYDLTSGTAVAPVAFNNIVWENGHPGRAADAYDGSSAEFVNERLGHDDGSLDRFVHFADQNWYDAQIEVGSTFTTAAAPPYYVIDAWNGSTPLAYIGDHTVHAPANWTTHLHACG